MIAWDLLSLVEWSNAPIDKAAADARMDVNRAKAVVEAASYVRSLTCGNGEFRHRVVELTPRNPHQTPRSIIPVRANWGSEKEIVSRFAPRFEALRGSRLLRKGLNSFVEFFWNSENCPVFADPIANGDSAKAFLDLLYECEIPDKEIRYGSFDCEGSASWTQWKVALGVRRRRHFESWNVPHDDGKSVRPWLGIKPTFASEA